MSKVVHPFSHRLGILRDWKSRWFGTRGKYQELLRGDVLIRGYLEKRLRGFYVAGVEIERSEKKLRIILKTSRPGMIIGRSGEGSAKLRQDILKETGRLKIRIPEEKELEKLVIVVKFKNIIVKIVINILQMTKDFIE